MEERKTVELHTMLREHGQEDSRTTEHAEKGPTYRGLTVSPMLCNQLTSPLCYGSLPLQITTMLRMMATSSRGQHLEEEEAEAAVVVVVMTAIVQSLRLYLA